MAVCADETLAPRLVAALDATGGLVELHATFTDLAPRETDVALCVVHLDGHLAEAGSTVLSRVPRGCNVVIVLPRANLAQFVSLMQASETVASLLVAEDLLEHQLTAIAARLLTRDLFGLGKTLGADVEVRTHTVHDYLERTSCIEHVAAFVAEHNLPRPTRVAIEQCIDEMLMNALYDAPVDDEGVHVFANVPVRTRTGLRIDQAVLVQYAFDGVTFGLSVRDAFGSLERATILRVLYKCLHADDKVDRKEGGAGVGLFLMVSEATSVAFHLVPGLATEAVCTFNVSAEQTRLGQLTVITERSDVTGALVSGRKPARALRPTPMAGLLTRHRRAVIGGATLVAVGAAILLAARLVRTPPLPPAATLRVESQPAGASVWVDGVRSGETPAMLTHLRPGADVALKLDHRGYTSADIRVQVPPPGRTHTHVEALTRDPALARVRLVSTPPGARVRLLDASAGALEDRTYTPADVFVEVNLPRRFVLTMPGYVPLAVEAIAPPGDGTLERGGVLAPGTDIRIEASVPGTVTVARAPHCADVPVPATCTLSPGTYELAFTAATGERQARAVDVHDTDLAVRFEIDRH